MSELSSKLNKLEKSLKKTSKQLTTLSETMKTPVGVSESMLRQVPSFGQPIGYYPQPESPVRSPYSDREETQYALKEDFEAVSLEDYNKLVKAYERKGKLAKEMKDIIQEYMEKTKDLEDNIDKLEKAYQTLEKERNDNINELSDEIEALKKKEDNLTKTLEENERKHEAQLKEAKTNKKTMKKILKAKDEEIDSLKTQLEATKRDFGTRNIVSSELKTQVKVLEEENGKLHLDSVAKSEEIRKLNKALGKLNRKHEGEIRDYEKRIEELQRKLEAKIKPAVPAKDPEETTELKIKVQLLQSEFERTKAESSKLQRENDLLNNVVKKYKGQMEEYEIKVHSLESTVIALRAEKGDSAGLLNAKCSEFAAAKNSWENKEKSYFDKIEELVNENKKIEKTLEDVLFERDRLQSELEEQNQGQLVEYGKMNAQIEKIGNEVRTLKAENAKYKEQIVELGKYKEKYKEAKIEDEQKERKITELEDKLEGSEEILQKLRDKVDRMAMELIEVKMSGDDDRKAGKKKAMMLNEIELLQSKIRSIRLHNK